MRNVSIFIEGENCGVHLGAVSPSPVSQGVARRRRGCVEGPGIALERSLKGVDSAQNPPPLLATKQKLQAIRASPYPFPLL